MFDTVEPHDGPVIVGLEKFETVYAKDQPQYRPLRTLPGRNGDSAIARFHFTDVQRKAIAEGADIYLELLHFKGPLAPSLIMVMSEPEDTENFRLWWTALTSAPYQVEVASKRTGNDKMADITGPISTLSGALHDVPDGMKCDNHPRRKAVARIQGETDSFGCEMHDLCAECAKADREWRRSPEAAEWRKGTCEWCKNPADDLRDRRDYEEGMTGRVYRVCGACVKRDNEYWAAEAAAYDDDRDDCDAWNDER